MDERNAFGFGISESLRTVVQHPTKHLYQDGFAKEARL